MTERGNDEPRRPDHDTPDAEGPKHYSLLQTLRAVAWGMLGIRKGKGHQEDFSRLNPLHLIIVGVVVTVIFVFALIAAARWFISYYT